MLRLAACLLLVAMGCQAEPQRSQLPNLALVVLDTVRVDHLSAYGYGRPTSPVLQALASEGTRFERAWSTSSWTLPAHASMFTGLAPYAHGADQSSQKLQGQSALLASLLEAQGYQAAGFCNNPWIADKTGLSQGFSEYQELWRKKVRPKTVLRHPTAVALERWLEGGWDQARPFFVFVNLMEAHGPYEPDDESLASVLGGESQLGGLREAYQSVGKMGLVRSHYLGRQALSSKVVGAARDLYDGEVRQADAALGEVLQALDNAADPGATTLLVVSDHGENFGEHGHMGHAFCVYDSLLRVAMVGRGPGFEAGRVDDGVAQLLDVFPTMLSAAGIAAPEGPGRDLRQAQPQQRGLHASYAYPRQVLSSFPKAYRQDPSLASHKRSFQVGLDGRYKLIRSSDGQEEIYDLHQDPTELTPLDTLPAARLQRLRALAALGEGTQREPEGEAEAEETDEETLQALRGLGYVE